MQQHVKFSRKKQTKTRGGEKKTQCSEEQGEGGTHFTLLQTLAHLVNKTKFHATHVTVILIVTQNCVRYGHAGVQQRIKFCILEDAL
jgi:hypothetical protein